MSTAHSDEAVAVILQNALQLVAPQAGSALGHNFGAFGVTDTHSADPSMSGSSAGGSRLGTFPGEDPDFGFREAQGVALCRRAGTPALLAE